LLIHGFCVDHRLLLGLDPVFESHGSWRRIYVDLPGMGASVAGAEIRSTNDVAAELVAFVRATFGSQKFAVLGNSFGGMLARHLVAEFGDQIIGMALLCPVVVADKARRVLPPATVLQQDSALLASLDPDDASAYAELAVLQNQENWERFRDGALPGLRAFDRSAIGWIAGNYSLSREPEQRVSNYSGPTLIITGRQDHVVGFEDQQRLASCYADATVRVLEEAGHNAHLDQPDATGAELMQWLNRIRQAVSGCTPGSAPGH
jgi:pimeloyl-ACP methyl ester carboxylesterase